jgi:predicted metal-dependent phosphoesterase TrpH
MTSQTKDFTDLHCHSVFSDGTHTPEELIALAKKKNLIGISLTDHDTIDGIEDLLTAGKAQQVNTITGIELSTNHGSLPVHILGYGFDHKNLSLHKNLEKIQHTRKIRNHKIFENIRKMGIDITWAQIKKIAGDGQIGRPHFAQFFIRQGRARNNAEAFSLYLRKDCPAYAEREILPIQDAIQIIHKSHGLAVIAHPGMLPCNKEMMIQHINTFIDMGLDGIEVYYPTHSKTLRNRLLQLCSEKDLVVTGGSDYHGGIRPNTSLGGFQRKHFIPAAVFTNLMKHLTDHSKQKTAAGSTSL